MLAITLIQSDLHWESPEANRAMFEEKIWRIGRSTDLIVLPEMFTTGFSMNPSALAEPMNLTTFRWMKGMAAQTGAAIAGSYIVTENGHYFNRLIWMQPDGTFDWYDKKHLFGLAGETQAYTPGNRRLVREWKGWRICPLVCYDLRFPVWSRNHSNGQGADYDLLLYAANWPSPRVRAWETLLPARAIENLSYAAGVNRTGTDPNGHQYPGCSGVFNYKGEPLWQAGAGEAMHTLELDKEELDDFRRRYPFLHDGQ